MRFLQAVLFSAAIAGIATIADDIYYRMRVYNAAGEALAAAIVMPAQMLQTLQPHVAAQINRVAKGDKGYVLPEIITSRGNLFCHQQVCGGVYSKKPAERSLRKYPEFWSYII